MLFEVDLMYSAIISTHFEQKNDSDPKKSKKLNNLETNGPVSVHRVGEGRGVGSKQGGQRRF